MFKSLGTQCFFSPDGIIVLIYSMDYLVLRLSVRGLTRPKTKKTTPDQAGKRGDGEAGGAEGGGGEGLRGAARAGTVTDDFGATQAEYTVLLVAEGCALWGECDCRAGQELVLCHYIASARALYAALKKLRQPAGRREPTAVRGSCPRYEYCPTYGRLLDGWQV
jgi:hypothetical protein